MRALVADPLGPAAERVLLAAGFEVKQETGLAGDALVAALAGRQALLVRGQTKVTADVLTKANGLRVVARAGAGVDNVDTKAAAAAGVAVYNAPGANAVSVAELTWGLIFALLRHIPEADATTRRGGWEKTRLAGVERVDVERIFDDCDIVSLHAPLGPGTRHLANAARLGRMRRGAFLINAARGGLVDEAALVEALREGRLGGAALDVLEQEPPGDSPLFALSNVVLTPHLGAATAEAQERAALMAAEAVKAHLAGAHAPGRVV
jgi:D-3-phosphoglycerate dehydrogenase